MQKSTLIGLVSGFTLIGIAIFMGQGWMTFISIPSILLVMGGTASALLVSYPLVQVQAIPTSLASFFRYEPPDLRALVSQFANLSRTARRDGLLALDKQLSDMDNELMRLGLELAIDGSDEDEISEMMLRKGDVLIKQKDLLTRFFTTAGTYAPAFGMIGTLIGLVQMLTNMNDPSQIGAGMATALITTLYGAILANLAFLPIADKSQGQYDDLRSAQDLIRAGVLAIVRGERPTLIERRLSVFIRETGTADNEAAPAEAESVDDDEPLSRAA